MVSSSPSSLLSPSPSPCPPNPEPEVDPRVSLESNESTDSSDFEQALLDYKSTSASFPETNYFTREKSACVENPLAGLSRDELVRDVEEFCLQANLLDYVEIFTKGALLAQNPAAIEDIRLFDAVDRQAIEREIRHKWDQPFALYWLVVMCSLAAAVQGMDETVNNGAQTFYIKTLKIDQIPQPRQDYVVGLVMGAPYLCCAVLGCWLTEPLNRVFARRGTVFLTCFIAAAASVWEGLCNDWVSLFAARFVLGLGIGPKSSTVPVYSAECAPAPIRGALVMMWQMWTAFGIMLGNIVGVAFGGLAPDLAWRLILGSTVFLPLVVCAQVYFCPESPRWYIQHGKPDQAFRSFQRLRHSDLQAARDTYYTHVGVQFEKSTNAGKNFFTMFRDLFVVPRNLRATWASWIVMFGQQFCGVNVIAYYSTNIFIEADYSRNAALLASMGTGILNWIFAIPAVFTIDRWGRRNLLLFTFPFLAIFLFWTGLSFFAQDDGVRIGLVTTGMYLFEVFYSPGAGPVPFVYAAECFPVYVRDVGMSFASATTWFFNFVLSFTWPSLVSILQPQGAFAFYAVWCIILWVLVLLYVPETKELTLEEQDQVFSLSTKRHATYQMRNTVWHFQTWILGRKLEPLPPLYGHDKVTTSPEVAKSPPVEKTKESKSRRGYQRLDTDDG